MKHAGQDNVVDIGPPAREKAGIFEARNGGTEITRAHRVPLRASAASSAASTMG